LRVISCASSGVDGNKFRGWEQPLGTGATCQTEGQVLPSQKYLARRDSRYPRSSEGNGLSTDIELGAGKRSDILQARCPSNASAKRIGLVGRASDGGTQIAKSPDTTFLGGLVPALASVSHNDVPSQHMSERSERTPSVRAPEAVVWLPRSLIRHSCQHLVAWSSEDPSRGA
jgi:hypothetical protein